ncbi:MAG: hypothetical protein ACR2MB_06485 [Acidimicrobiales bacterium]
MSAVLHGSAITTKDVDTVALWTRANLSGSALRSTASTPDHGPLLPRR